LIRNPIRKVLSTLQSHNVRFLLMGGQACVFYGAAEFSRDTDIVLLAEPDNIRRLSSALDELKAETIAVPPFSETYLKRGHAVHFRCSHQDAARIRIDVMSVLRGLDSFPELWERRTTVTIEAGETYELLSLGDLVLAKKTQRDKDWPMLRRLVEAHYVAGSDAPSQEQVAFWLREARTPSILIELAESFPEPLVKIMKERRLLRHARSGRIEALERSLMKEEAGERERDRKYWKPLVAELEGLRHCKSPQGLQ